MIILDNPLDAPLIEDDSESLSPALSQRERGSEWRRWGAHNTTKTAPSVALDGFAIGAVKTHGAERFGEAGCVALIEGADLVRVQIEHAPAGSFSIG